MRKAQSLLQRSKDTAAMNTKKSTHHAAGERHAGIAEAAAISGDPVTAEGAEPVSASDPAEAAESVVDAGVSESAEVIDSGQRSFSGRPFFQCDGQTLSCTSPTALRRDESSELACQ